MKHLTMNQDHRAKLKMQGEISKGCENRILTLNASSEEMVIDWGKREVQEGKNMKEIIKKNRRKHDRIKLNKT